MRTTVAALKATIVVSLGLLAVVATALGHGQSAEPVQSVVTVSPSEHHALALIRDHGCWVGAAPADMAGKLPGHVVAARRGGPAVYGGPAMVAQALDQVFAGRDHGLQVRAFCR